MTKGLSSSFVGLYRGILTDISVYHPTLHEELERDFKRLESLARYMGEKVFTLLLPALGKIFDQSLETGVLAFAGEPLSRSFSRKSKIPRLFRGIWRQIFLDNGCLKDDIDPNDVFFLRTLLYAGKKYLSECTPSSVFYTVREYMDVESSLPIPSDRWDGDGSNLGDLDFVHLEQFSSSLGGPLFAGGEIPLEGRLLRAAQECADRVAGRLGEYLPQLSGFRHGPGAVSDLTLGKDYKYAFPEWGPRLQWLYPAVEYAVSSLSAAEDSDDYESAGIPLREGASRLYAVPKTQKGPRLIAAEPTCHQWCQQSVRSFLNDAIANSPIGQSIDFSRQDLSGERALAASRTGADATVDLSSASDRLSCFLVERVFRKNPSLLSAMIASRTRFLVNDIDKKQPNLIKLRKFASMGSALTFPVQSLVFLTLCLGAGLVAEDLAPRYWRRLLPRVRVYGDDLIVPVSWMPYVETLFKSVLLKINGSKTFRNGKFRESCGSDCFDGYYVSPGQVRQFYDESKPSTLESVIETANNLFKHGLWHASNAVLSAIPQKIKKLIPCVDIGSGTFGLHSGSGFHSFAKSRWNEALQVREYACLHFGARSSHTRRFEGFANLLQYFTEDPSLSQIVDWESGLVAKPTPTIRRGWVQG